MEDSEPLVHSYCECELELSLDGVDYLVVASPVEERSVEGKVSFYFDRTKSEVLVCTAKGEDWDDQNSLLGDALKDWLLKYEVKVAEQAAEIMRDRLISRAEERG